MLATLALFHDGAFINSPFIVPVAGTLMILGIVLGGIWSGIRSREIESTERLAAIAKGLAPPPTPAELAIIHGRPSANYTRRRANIRLTGIILLGTAVGLICFFIVLATVLQIREVLSGAAVGLIPLAIGIAFLIDARIQTREMEDSQVSPTIAPPTDLVH
ncbi:MAG TPA: DUF6249 domain-containing protein [Acidobacteriaceae bacterium]